MNKQSEVLFRQGLPGDRQAVVDFLYAIGDELYFDERVVAEEIVALLYERGGVIVGETKGLVTAVTGYFRGDPADDYANREIGFIYVAGLAKTHRGTAAFRTGLRFVMETFQTMGLQEVRFHALAQDVRLNAIYGSFAQPMRQETNRRGFDCVLYGSSIDRVLDILDTREKRPYMVAMPPIGRPLVSGIHGV